MDTDKIANFKRDHPSHPFPQFEPVGPQQARHFRDALASKIGDGGHSSAPELLKCLYNNSIWVRDVNPKTAEFSLRQLFSNLSIYSAETVYINWGGFDEIDSVRFVDLSRWFYDIWYSEDIEIFDDSTNWVVFFRHWDSVSYIKF